MKRNLWIGGGLFLALVVWLTWWSDRQLADHEDIYNLPIDGKSSPGYEVLSSSAYVIIQKHAQFPWSTYVHFDLHVSAEHPKDAFGFNPYWFPDVWVVDADGSETNCSTAMKVRSMPGVGETSKVAYSCYVPGGGRPQDPVAVRIAPYNMDAVEQHNKCDSGRPEFQSACANLPDINE